MNAVRMKREVLVRTQVGVADTQNFANTNVLTTGGEPPYSTIGICEGSCLREAVTTQARQKGHRAGIRLSRSDQVGRRAKRGAFASAKVARARVSEANVVGICPFAFSSARCEATCVPKKRGFK